MYEDLFELMVEGAFADRAEFDAFINDEEVTPEDIYSLITEGAFKDYEEFQSVYATNDVIDSEVKKKDEPQGNPFSLSTEQELPDTPVSTSQSDVSMPTLDSTENQEEYLEDPNTILTPNITKPVSYTHLRAHD